MLLVSEYLLRRIGSVVHWSLVQDILGHLRRKGALRCHSFIFHEDPYSYRVE